MFRSVLPRLLKKHQGLPNFWVRGNGVTTIVSAKNSVLPSVSKRKPLEKGYVIFYLVNSCGLSREKAISASTLVHFDSPDRPNAVVNFFGKQGFTQSQITTLVEKCPALLAYDPQKSLLPKFDFFLRSTGISEKELPTIVSRCPDLLTRSFEREVAPAYNYVKGIIGAEKVDNLIRTGYGILNLDLSKLVPNVDLLREVGVPQQFIEFALSSCTDIFLSDHAKLKKVVEKVKQMGFNPLKSNFIMETKARLGEGCEVLRDQCNEARSKRGCSKDEIDAKTYPKSFCEWLAGIIDGDGSIQVGKNGYTSLEVFMGLEDLRLMRYIQNKLGGSVKMRAGARAYRYRLHHHDGMVKLMKCINGHIRHSARLLQLHRVCQVLEIPVIVPIPLDARSNWFAGFFDANGTISIAMKDGVPQLTIEITNKLLQDIEVYKVVFGGSLYFDSGRNGYYQWSIQSLEDIMKFLDYFKSNTFRSHQSQRFFLIKKYYSLYDLKAFKPDSIHHKAWLTFLGKWNKYGEDNSS